jgi:hypothetical protein
MVFIQQAYVSEFYAIKHPEILDITAFKDSFLVRRANIGELVMLDNTGFSNRDDSDQFSTKKVVFYAEGFL